MMYKTKVKTAIKNPRGVITKIVRNSRQKIDIPLGKAIYKNTAGFEFNLKGDLTKFRTKQTRSEEFEQKDPMVLELSSKGYTKFGYPYDKDLIERLGKRFNELINDEKFSIVRSQFKGKVYSRQLFNIHNNIPEVKYLITDKIISLFQQYFQGPFRAVNIYAFHNKHVPPELAKQHELFSSNWHCDATNTSRIKLFVYLSDVSEKDGPFFAQTIERTRQLIKMGFKSRYNPSLPVEVLENPKYALKFVGNAGCALACNTGLCLHRATMPEEGHLRDLIQIHLEPSNEPLSKDWINELEDDSCNFSLQRNNIVSGSIT